MQKISEFFKYCFGDFFCGGLLFFGGGVGLSRGLRAFDVPQGATCGLGETATGGLEIMLCTAPRGGDPFHT